MTIVNGSVADADDVLQITKIEEIYTGSGFNCSDDTQDHELTAIAASKLIDATYLEISITGTAYTQTSAGNFSDISLKIQAKEVGGAYSDSMAYKVIQRSTGVLGATGTTTIKWIHTLTAGQITNGVQVKIFAAADGAAGAATTFTNIQTTIKVRN